MTPSGYFREAMLLDLNCPDIHVVLEKASRSRVLNRRHAWLLLHNSSAEPALVEDTLYAYEILPDADVVWSSPYNLVDVYKTKPNQPLLQVDLGLSRNSSRREMLSLWGALPTAVTRRRDLRNVSLKGITVKCSAAGAYWWQVRPPADGLLRRVAQRVVRRAGGPPAAAGGGAGARLAVHATRPPASKLSCTVQAEHFVHRCAFIFRQPSRSAVSNVFLAPFSGGVWGASACVAASAALLLAALRRLRLHTRAATDLQLFTLPEAFTFALGSLCQQGRH
ncbi:hypothetical protein HF086_007219 [Spodoptera exigua]|uniref:Ionotropic receptor 75a N-terminal domain-containing protein n=1 Tax=Spodoptera exigua TaxID=7107 RepID=A0A922MT02_SPOEX|nr:hypothetical protein HF086_007219 [Spodoptera exigua]